MAVVIALCVCCSAVTGAVRVTGQEGTGCLVWYVMFSFPIKR